MQPELSSGCMLADHAHQVPRCTAPDFIDRIEDIVRANGIRLIVPTIDTELMAYAEAAPRLAAAGAYVHVSPPEVIAVVRDKTRTMEVLAAADLPVPDTCSEAELRAEPDRLGWPVFGKPVGGSASRGLGSYDSFAVLPDSFPEPMMFQPVLKGPEYTVNIFVDRAGQLQTVVPHLRIQTRAGEVEKGRTTRRADLRALAEGIVRALPQARGVLCFQVIDDAARGPRIIEINARFGGGYPLAHHAGAHFADWLMAELAGRPSGASDDWRDGVTMLRYDDAVFTG
ncbi:ATP-grasp domain-containing protein [Paracoccus sp. 12-3]|nr:ATP-grasp domain-containing protein [Paracoccus xiamenensis]